jgi:fructose-1,6-bisphosphatase/inositol monophosphatase family enzyme
MKILSASQSDPIIAEISDTAVRAAKAAGDIQMAYFEKRQEIYGAKPHDIKLEVDRLCEAAILKTIHRQFPEHTIIAEENGMYQNNSEYLWIVDPLDGSINYLCRIPYFGCCVACYFNGKSWSPDIPTANNNLSMSLPLVGVVYAPLVDELFLGVAGEPATCNGRTISASLESVLDDAVISISFGSTEAAMQRMEKLSSSLVRRVRKIRILGSTGLDMVNIARGRMSALLQAEIRIWDFAAARIVLEQSGGRFDAKEVSAGKCEILACAPGIYSSLKQIMNEDHSPA